MKRLPEPLAVVARRLGNLGDRVVFVGGMIRELLVTDPAAGRPRPTDDVDVIVNVGTRVELAQFDAQLRSRGFQEANEEGAPICRWRIEGVKVDVMPVDPAVLGFSNVWYPSGLAHPMTTQASETVVRHLDGPHFCATKLEAFASRGDGFYHHDLEDFIALIDGRAELLDEIAKAEPDLGSFLVARVAELLGDEGFIDALPGHLEGDAASQARLPLVLQRLRAIANLSSGSPAEVALPGPPPPFGRAEGWVAVRSSNLVAVRYDDSTSSLLVQFKDGSAYAYDGVPKNTYLGLLQASSKGRYFTTWIKNRYRYARL